MSLGEDAAAPTAMLYRNLARQDVEESIRGNPLDGVVLLAVATRPRPRPSWARRASTCRRSSSRRADAFGQVPRHESARHQRLVHVGRPARRQDHHRGIPRAESCMHRLARPLHGDGTASTWPRWWRRSAWGCPANAAYPAVDARRNVIARMAGEELFSRKEKILLSKILTKEAFENAIRTLSQSAARPTP